MGGKSLVPTVLLVAFNLFLIREQRRVLRSVTSDQFYAMLGHAVQRLKYSGTEPFQDAVDANLVPDYGKYIVAPMDVAVMERKVARREYVALEQMVQDMKWIVHNCHVFNGAQSKLTAVARSMMRTLRHEVRFF